MFKQFHMSNYCSIIYVPDTYSDAKALLSNYPTKIKIKINNNNSTQQGKIFMTKNFKHCKNAICNQRRQFHYKLIYAVRI